MSQLQLYYDILDSRTKFSDDNIKFYLDDKLWAAFYSKETWSDIMKFRNDFEYLERKHDYI